MPSAFPSPGIRELKSRQAVFKTVSNNQVVFSHMMISPEDTSKLFKNSDMVGKLTTVQQEVHPPE